MGQLIHAEQLYCSCNSAAKSAIREFLLGTPQEYKLLLLKKVLLLVAGQKMMADMEDKIRFSMHHKETKELSNKQNELSPKRVQ